MRLSTVIALFSSLLVSFSALASENDSPMGWATCTSVESGDDYNLTGGGDGSFIVIRNDGTDIRKAIADAVKNYEVIIFDGKNGEFVLPSNISFISLSGRTLIGINGACFRTEFAVTQEIRDLLDELNVNSLSQNAGDNLGGTLSNGSYVAEQRELTIRQAIIDRFGDEKEAYRNSGVFSFVNCSNLIIRNIDFIGPGSIDVGGADLLTVNACDHVWVDGCRFTDGMDGNFDIGQNSDFITVSDCHFRYTSLSYNHPLSNLTAATEMPDGTPQKNNITWLRCFWDRGCTGRMPYTTLGIYHLLNCYWDNNDGTCIDAHNKSRLLIERCYFTSNARRPLAVRDNNEIYEWRETILQGRGTPASNGKVNVPYTYSAESAMSVPQLVRNSAGPKLDFAYQRPLTAAPAVLNLGQVYARSTTSATLNLSVFGHTVPSSLTVTAPAGIVLSTEKDGEYSSTITLNRTEDKLFMADFFVKACFDNAGEINTTLEVTGDDTTLSIPVKAQVIAVEGEVMNTTIAWPFDRGASSPADAVVSQPQVIEKASFTLGPNIYIRSAMTIDGNTFTLFNPGSDVSRVADPDCSISFDVATAPGYIFVPKRLSFNASRIGTDMVYIDVEASRGDNAPLTLLLTYQPSRSSNSPAVSEVELPLENLGVGDNLHITVYLYYILSNKQLALSDFTIYGDSYRATTGIDEILKESHEDINTEYFDLMGRPVAHPRTGHIYILRTTDGHSLKIKK